MNQEFAKVLHHEYQRLKRERDGKMREEVAAEVEADAEAQRGETQVALSTPNIVAMSGLSLS